MISSAFLTGIVVIVIIIAILLFVISTYNGLIRMRNQCDEAFSTMDVYLKKRFDLIPNLVATVKGYAKHEAETLEKVIAARNQATGLAEKVESEGQITSALKSIFALAENYPDLKANESFVKLQGQLEKIETDIEQSRKYYNGCVKQYRDKRMVFPSNIIAGIFHFEDRPMFEVTEAAERENVKVEF